jgi:hypothetical protein
MRDPINLFELDLEICTEDSKLLDTAKSVFWSNTLNYWTGGITLTNWLGGIGVNLVKTHQVNLASSLVGLGTGSSKLAGNIIHNAAILRIFASAMLPSVLLGLVIYRSIKYSDILDLKTFEQELFNALRLMGKQDIINTIDEKYKQLLKNLANENKDPKLKLQLAAEQYILFLNDHAIFILIDGYIDFYKTNHINIGFIESFQDLMQLKITNNILLRNQSDIYKQYLNVLNIYVFDKTQIKTIISKLDKHVKIKIGSSSLQEGFLSNLSYYFTNPKAAKYGGLLIGFMTLSDIAVGSILSGKLISASYIGLSSLIGSSISIIAAPFLPLLLVITGTAIYRGYQLDATKKIFKLAKLSNKLSKELGIEINSNFNDRYQSFLDSQCKLIQDEDRRINCAMSKYLDLYTNEILLPILDKYIIFVSIYLDKDDLENINSFNKLARTKLNNDLSKNIYDLYICYQLTLEFITEYDKLFASKMFNLINKFIKSKTYGI